MKTQLYIPKEIKVGFQHRSGTYTGLLAYIIYRDDKGKLRKEASWESWRHKEGRKVHEYANGKSGERIIGDEINPKDIKNVPTEGFVLNKGVGGQRESYGWNARNEYIRVYDPRGFEFEISVANLLFILQETSAIQGKGLEGEFVYSWSGKDLVLLPAMSQDYKESSKYTGLQAKKISARTLQIGCPYLTKNQETLVYIGRFSYHVMKEKSKYVGYDYSSGRRNRSGYEYTQSFSNKKAHIFCDIEGKTFTPFADMTKLAELKSEDQVINYADIMDKFNATKNSSAPVEIVLDDVEIVFPSKDGKNNYHGREIGTFAVASHRGTDLVVLKEKVEYQHNRNNDRAGEYILKGYVHYIRNAFSITDNKMNKQRVDNYYSNETAPMTKEEVLAMNLKTANVVLENGNKVNLKNY